MEKFLLFTTGSGTADPLNWSSDEASLYPVSQLKGMKPANLRSIDLFFETTYRTEVVTLGIKNSTHAQVMTSISNALNSSQTVITIADVDSSVFCSPFINDVKIKTMATHCQNLTGNIGIKEKVTLGRRNYSSCLATNTTTTNVRLTMYLASQLGTDITDTTSEANGNFAKGLKTAVAIQNTGTAATSDMFLNERVYKQDGTFVGICTVFTGATSITFGGGLEVALTDEDDLFTGTRYFLLNAMKIPRYETLKLEYTEIAFDNSLYDLYASTNKNGGLMTLMFHH